MPFNVKLKTVAACSLFAMSLSSLAAGSNPSGPQGADAQGDYPWRKVKFADLDLTHDQGAAVLYARIKSAAREVCLPTYNWLAELRASSRECRDRAIARAVGDVNTPTLTTYYLEHTQAVDKR
jgi:UrcA family protein